MTPSKTFVSCCVALCLAVAACEAASYPYLFAFGDSWVDDNGVQGAFKAFGAPPSPPNAWRFSNGPTWPRFLAEEVGISCNWTESDTAAGLNCTNYKNYAMGGACAADWNDNAAVEEYCEVGPNNDLTNNLDAQIQLFLAEGFASQVINDALFAISIGGNDMNGIVNADGGFTDKAENLQGGDDKVLDAIEAGITALHGAGMRNLLILNLPPILITPRAIALDLNIAEYQFVDEYLESYSENADELFEEIDLAGLTITQGNLRGCLRELEVGKYGGMEGAGFDNWVDACIDDRNDPDSPVCDTPETYFFFDDIHPTTAAHQWIGGELAKALDGGSPDDVCMLSECFGDSLLDSCFNAAGLVVPSLLAVAGAAVAAFLA